MGNCCGSQSAVDDDRPAPGRQYQQPPAPPRTSKPKVKKSSEGRTLGGSGEPGGGIDPRTAAALAAEQRNQELGKGGKLASQLAADRSKSRQQHLKDAAETRQEPANLQWD